MNSRGRRTYVLGRRAESQETTRRRIVQATVDLHAMVGPARTTVSAVAARAGVQRHTVYRHFPDDTSLLRACATHFLAHHPPPDPGSWAATADPGARLRRGLAELYAYYEKNEAMIAKVLRDSELLPVGAGFRTLQAEAARGLMQGPSPGGRPGRPVAAVLTLATDFFTWRSLSRGSGLTSTQAAQAMSKVVTCVRRPGVVDRSRRGL